VPPTPAATGGLKEVIALLVPFLHPTPQDIANNLLYFYIRYHLQLGFSKFVQYTQVRCTAPSYPHEQEEDLAQVCIAESCNAASSTSHCSVLPSAPRSVHLSLLIMLCCAVPGAQSAYLA
jgi:hypothetical protein